MSSQWSSWKMPNKLESHVSTCSPSGPAVKTVLIRLGPRNPMKHSGLKNTRKLETDLPILAVEVDSSDSLAQLRNDARFWLTNPTLMENSESSSSSIYMPITKVFILNIGRWTKMIHPQSFKSLISLVLSTAPYLPFLPLLLLMSLLSCFLMSCRGMSLARLFSSPRIVLFLLPASTSVLRQEMARYHR